MSPFGVQSCRLLALERPRAKTEDAREKWAEDVERDARVVANCTFPIRAETQRRVRNSATIASVSRLQ